MIKSHIEDDQDNWDLILDKIAFAYNTSTHESTKQTPFELQFGRKPKLPIDILLPNVNLYTREKILKEVLIEENGEQIIQLEDLDENIFEQKLPQVAQFYLENLKTSMQASFNACQQNVNIRMNKEKWSHDRNIKRFAYKIGDYVLCDHTKLKKGMSRGISHKYYGPFIIKRIDVNNVDYIIQRANTKKGKLYKINKNRLKFYHMCNNKLKQTALVSDSLIEKDNKK